MIKINIINTGISEGYLPCVDVGYDDVYVEGIVRTSNNACQIMAINTRDDDISIEVDPREILPFDYAILDYEPGSKVDIPVSADNPITDVESRIKRLEEIIPTDHLNFEEENSVKKLIRDFPQIFLLPGDPLPCTNAVQHHIPTENDIPVNAKQYRHPLVHKDFIAKDIQKKLTTVSSNHPTARAIHPSELFPNDRLLKETPGGEWSSTSATSTKGL